MSGCGFYIAGFRFETGGPGFQIADFGFNMGGKDGRQQQFEISDLKFEISI
jgi:hypothetical protein